MKFGDFDLDLTKVAEEYGAHPLSDDCAEMVGSNMGSESDYCFTDKSNCCSQKFTCAGTWLCTLVCQ